jgi:gluconolactonase
MKRILPLVLLPLGLYVFACKSSSNDGNGTAGDGTNEPGDGTGNPGDPGSPGGPVDPNEKNINPTADLQPATPILEAGQFTDGPVWHAQLGVLFFSTPLGEGALYRMLPDGRVLKVRDGNKLAGTTPIGNTVNLAGEIITVDAKRVVRMPLEGGEPATIATSWSGGVPPPPAQGDGSFDTLNDVVARKDGTLYVTDPGYFATPVANRIYRIDTAGVVQVVEAFDDVPRPNGIALSPDEKTLYVSFTAPVQGTLPFIRKYIVNDDGSLGEWVKFTDVGPADSTPDGLAVDRVGNVYCATKAGVEVFKPDGQSWGKIAIPEKPTGMSFGGPDMKTLYVTTEGIKIWQVAMKVTGVAQ